MTTLVVDLADLRAALRAVKTHIPTAKAEPRLARARFTPFAQNVEISATDRYTIALALVSVVDYEGADAEPWDLGKDDIDKVLAVFPAPDDEVLIRIEATAKEVTFTDVAGLIPGESLTLQRATSGQDDLFPDIRRLFAGSLRQGHSLVGEWWISPALLHRFEVASSVYGEPMVCEPIATGAALTVRIGESFLGRIALTRVSEDAQIEAANHARAWDDRLPLPADVEQRDSGVVAPMYGGADKESDDARAARMERDRVEQLAHAAEIVVSSQFGSVSMLRRKLGGIPLSKAQRLMDELEALGIVGAADGTKARDVLRPAHAVADVAREIRGERP